MPETEKKQKSKGYISSMNAELKKVTWPSSGQVAKSTVNTIAFVLLIAAILIVLNLAFENLSALWWSMMR